MRFAEPAGGKIANMNNAQPRMQSGEIIQDLARGIRGTVVHRHNFEMRIINFHKRREGSGQFLFFIARGKKKGHPRAFDVGRRRNVLNNGETQRAVCDVESVENPERSDEPAENQSE
jgi:hypothetical protein